MKKPAPGKTPGHGKGGGGKGGKPSPRQKKPKPGRRTPKPKPVSRRVKIIRLRRRIHQLQHPKHTAHHHHKRQLSPGSEVACCSAEALAASLRLLGVAVGDEDVLALYWRTASDADEGASILATLEVAAESGLAGVRLAKYQPWPGNDNLTARNSRSCVILGAELPDGAHALAVGPDGAWWSWGEPYSPRDFPGAVIEEAWEIRWELPRGSADVH